MKTFSTLGSFFAPPKCGEERKFSFKINGGNRVVCGEDRIEIIQEIYYLFDWLEL